MSLIQLALENELCLHHEPNSVTLEDKVIMSKVKWYKDNTMCIYGPSTGNYNSKVYLCLGQSSESTKTYQLNDFTTRKSLIRVLPIMEINLDNIEKSFQNHFQPCRACDVDGGSALENVTAKAFEIWNFVFCKITMPLNQLRLLLPPILPIPPILPMPS